MSKKVLIINIFGIGDVLFTTPIIHNIKSHFKDSSIGYLCNRRAEDVVKSNPKIDKVFVYERDEFVQISKESKILFLRKFFELVNDIRKEHYDIVIDVSLSSFTAFIGWLAGIKVRIGFNYKNRSILLNKRIKLTGYDRQHVVEYYLDLLNEIGIPVEDRRLELTITNEDEAWADSFMKDHGLTSQPVLIGLVPGGGASWGKDASFKRWPAEKWAKIADKMIEKHSAAIILMGDAFEHDLCLRIAHLMHKRPVLAVGRTTLSQFGALAKKCSLVIVNDGGPLHIAVASGAKTVSIFGPVNENVYGPYPQKGHAVVTAATLCRPCYRKFRRASCSHVSCLNDITIENVLKNVEDILSTLFEKG
ncbi:MAG: lipopolysaccharide heptosyltransferase II [Candidatus Omnitrophica bacterium]|nr:lipopolysaccharide heptosyltransferase II [Candidatus Omnitrophota bacterium]